MENAHKVQEILNELNRNNLGRPWVAVPGYNAMTGFSFGSQGNQPTFDASSGYPVKIFVNTRTGEVKVYSAYVFKV